MTSTDAWYLFPQLWQPFQALRTSDLTASWNIVSSLCIFVIVVRVRLLARHHEEYVLREPPASGDALAGEVAMLCARHDGGGLAPDGHHVGDPHHAA